VLEQHVVARIELDELGARDLGRKTTAFANGDHFVAARVERESWRSD
jgi:hypothetical protein